MNSPPSRTGSPLTHRLRIYVDALLFDLRSSGERGRLVRETLVMLTMRVTALGVAFVAGVIYARTLKASGYGIYAYVIAWNEVMLTLVSLGLPEYLVREAAKDTNPDRLRGVLRWADRRIVSAGLIGAATISCVSFVVPGTEDMGRLFLIAAWFPLLSALAYARQSLLRASDAVIASQWPAIIMVPTLMLVLLLLWLLQFGYLSPITLLAAMLLSLVTGLLVQEWQLRKRLGTGPTNRVSDLSLRASFPFMLISAIWYINSRVDLLILGSLKSHAEVGIYAVVLRLAGLVMVTTFTVNTIIAPRIASYHYQNDHGRLQRLLTASTLRTFLVCLPLGLVLMLAGGPLLGAVFGQDFATGWSALAILVAAQLFSIMCGPTAIVLNMAGLERITNRVFALATLLNAVLNFILIPTLGIVGAALATSVSLIAWNVVLLTEVRSRLKLRPSAMGL